jgi:three-Cys-motif partner protein
MKKGHSENTVGPWATKKLDALEGYLKAYLIALNRQSFTKVYIDAFAGSCVSRIRSPDKQYVGTPLLDEVEDATAQDQFLLGSPLRALAAGDGFSRYYFFDVDESRAETLGQLKVTNFHKNIEVRVGDSNPLIVSLAKTLSKPNIRGVAFLDPYGPHLEWVTIEALAATKNVEVIINFPAAMAINRLITKSGNVPENWSRLLTACFGTDEWKSVAYNSTRDLFGQEIVSKNQDVSVKLLKLYLERLGKLFSCVATPRLIRNTRNAPLYYLIWAGPNKLGLKIADHILKQGDKVR